MHSDNNPANVFPTPNGDYVPAEEIERYTLGREGKLWTVHFEYDVEGQYCTQTKRNLTNPEVMNLRKAAIQWGILHFIRKGEWRIVMPTEFKMFLYRQTEFFNG